MDAHDDAGATSNWKRHNTYLVFPTKQTKAAPRQRQAA
jgi:hypothetical protein